MTLTTEAFPESTSAKLQNFANWYSYYSNRMLMMKTAAGQAFQTLDERKYRVGYLAMNNNQIDTTTTATAAATAGMVEVAPFDAAQKVAWYAKLYAANPGSNTPLREALSHVGQYYAHKFGTNTFYTSTITVGGSGISSLDGITVNGVEIMEDASDESASTSTVATNIAAQINAMAITEYGAKASGNVVTIIGSDAVAAGRTPVITKSGDMTFSATAFTTTTTTSKLNGITPADPIEFSCQQNFTILSTDGYWNGSTTYDLANNTVGQQDGTAARPMNDGAQASTSTTVTYSRNTYTYTATGCTSPQKKKTTQPQQGTCIDTGSGSCTPTNWTNLGSSTQGACATFATTPATDAAVETTRVTTAGSSGGTSNTLADVAMYYYNTDLRTPVLGNCTGALGGSGNVCENDVFITGTDNNTKQHMTTFTLGLGARGRMNYSSSYLTDTTGDYLAVKLGSTASSSICTWQSPGTTCTWPIPSSGAIENIDDLWHAAVNGHGAFFSATDPTSLAFGLSNALSGINARKGAAAAAATSTLNPVAGNNFAYVASYTTVAWKGGLEARGINTISGVVSENATWCVENVPAGTCATTPVAQTVGDTTVYNCVTGSTVEQVATACTGTMNAKVAAASDTRTIKTPNTTGTPGTALIDFDAAYATANPTNFAAAHINTLGQWSSLDATQKTAAEGTNLINFLRGQSGHEDRSTNPAADRLYRFREAVLGDALESQPAFISAPVFSYSYPGYSAFATAQAARAGRVYMGANDGMMHAFAADTGIENWSYVPSMVIPNMWRLADINYATSHRNFVNGSPTTSDICTANCSCDTVCVAAGGTAPVWKTILVAGLNGGGRGYYALDITTPATPTLLWEITPTSGIGRVTDDDIGYGFGQPIVTRKADGTWVVLLTSGYDNGTLSADPLVANSLPAGDGKGYLYVLNAGTGAIISKITTNVGDATTPSGLAKIASWNDDPTGNQTTYVYGGDLQGNLWRFNINSTTAATVGTGEVLKFATLFSDTAATSPQPIMTTPVLGKIIDKRVVFIGTGKYLETGDLALPSPPQTQTQYAIKDDNATATLVNPRTTLVNQTLTNNPDGTATRLATSNTVDFYGSRGWYFNFPDSGERANIDSKLVQGTLLIPTIVPRNSDCSPGGYGWLNFVDYKTGGALSSTSPLASVKYDATIVGINVIYIGGSPKVSVVTSADPTPSLNESVSFAASTAGFTGKRVLWREFRP
jgi:type IV pilus assembly protein PilY1